MEEVIRFTLNGKPVEVTAEGDRKLLWALRGDLATTGPKYGCGEGMYVLSAAAIVYVSSRR